MDATFYADCEIIIKAFEKSAAFSSDPKSVYALSTSLISKGMGNAEAVDRQIGHQFEHSEREIKKMSGGNESAFLSSNASNQNGNQATAPNATGLSLESATPVSSGLENSQTSETPAGDWWADAEAGGWKLEKCIPCAARIAGAEMAINDFGERFEGLGDILENNLKGILAQLLQLMEMFKDQGRSTLKGLCEFIDIFQFDMCPSDLMRIIAALSASLTKISIDIFGDIGMFLSLAKAILTPILSAVVQLLHNFMQMIIDPVHCIIDAIQKELIGTTGSMMEALSNTRGAWQFDWTGKSTLANKDWSLTQKDPPRTPDDSVLASVPIVSGAIPAAEGLSGYHPPQTKSSEIWDESYKQEDWGSYEEFVKLEQEIQKLESQDLEVGSPQYKTLKAKREEFNKQDFNKATKAVKDFNKNIDKWQTQFNTIFEATFVHLSEIARYIEDFLTSWIDELAKLVGGALTIEFGFAQKGVQKLGLITLIGSFLSLLDLLSSDPRKTCNNAEALEHIIQAQFKGTDYIIQKEEDGGVSVLGIDVGGNQAKFDLTQTGNEEIDSAIQKVVNEIQQPAASVTFNCRNFIPQDADANQINEWISQLETAEL
jgi:hypothetical protein